MASNGEKPNDEDNILNNRVLINKIIEYEINDFLADKPDSIDIEVEPKDPVIIHVLIRGREGTPYHNGFFYFIYR